jgi:cobalt-zinc-cadmium resistance protein CzcA
MFDRIIHGSLHNRSLIVLLLAALVATGTYSLLSLPVDAVPDITNVQVMALTSAPALGPEEIEQFVTIPVENAMNGIPRVQEVRSFSQFGLSGVTIVFSDGTDIYWARQQVGERLNQVRTEIPEEFGRPEMGPIATGLGEIIQIEVRNARAASQPRSLMELRTILDWDVARQLKSVPGVVEVNAFGGELKTYEVALDPGRLKARGIAVNRVFEAIRANNANSGGGYLERNGELRVIRGVGLVRSLEALESIVLMTAPDGTPVSVRDVADVRFAPMIRNGAVTRDGRGEAVTATVLMLAGENSRVVVNRIKEKLDSIRGVLPAGVEIDMYYDRATLIEKTIKTVSKNLAEGALLVVAVLIALLGNLRAGLIVAVTIPLSMLFAGNLMLAFGIAGSLMSLGALDFGLIVDSSVILIENTVARLSHARPGRTAREIIEEAAVEVRKPIVFGVAIITLVHLPILALEGVEGKMFRPMALTVIFALLGSLILTFTATPVLASFFLKPGLTEKETLPIRLAKRMYEPTLRWVIARPGIVVLLALALVAGTVPIAGQLGGEFIPKLDEGDIVIGMTRPPSGGLEEAIADSTRLEQALVKAFPDEVKSVVSRTGRPEIGIDPGGVNITDVFIFLKDKKKWKKAHSKAELIPLVEATAREALPGTFFNFTQPIESRFNDLLSGVRADVGLSLYGDDLKQLQQTADALAAALQSIPGASDVKAQVLQGLPFLRVSVDRDRVARYGINVDDVLDVIRALGGQAVGQVVEGQRRFDIQVRFGPEFRNDIESIRALQIMDNRGRMVPLEDLAEIANEDGVYEIWRKDRQRRAMIQANVRGRDLAGFVADAQKKVAETVPLPEGYRLDWGGTFENMQAATKRLTIVVPVALGLIFLMLYGTFGSVKLGLLIFLSVPLGAIGGILALWLVGLNLSVSAGVGFIALSGVAVLDGLVLVSAIRQLIEDGHPVQDSVYRASMSRLRPILMTGLVAGLGFIPMAIATGSGAEVQRPLATVVIGGLVTSTLLKLVVLPAIYRWFDPGMPKPAFEPVHVEPREEEEAHDGAPHGTTGPDGH